MTKGQMLDRISSDSLHEATGRGWDEWLETLDAAGAADWNHKEIVAYLKREHGDTTTRWNRSRWVPMAWATAARIGSAWDTATTVWPATISAPALKGIRRRWPATGAETT